MECCALSLFTETLKYTEYIKCKVNTSTKKIKLQEFAGDASSSTSLFGLPHAGAANQRVTWERAKFTRLFGVRAAAGFFPPRGGTQIVVGKIQKKRSPHPRIKYK